MLAERRTRSGVARVGKTETGMSKVGGGDSKNTLYCSFCGQSQHEVRKLVAGPTVFICDQCVELCVDIISLGKVDGEAEYFSWFGTRVANLDIDWSQCFLVQRHPGFISGALGMHSSPRMPVEGL